MTRYGMGWLVGLGLVLGVRVAPLQAEAAWSGRLLTSRLTEGTWQIWETDLATSTSRQLTRSQGDKRYPTLDAQQRIAFQTGNYAAYALTPAADEQPVLETYWPVRDLAWAAGAAGVRLAFSRVRTDLVDSANIWVRQAEGNDVRMLTDEAGIQYHPAWSSDGQELVYVGGHGFGTYEIYRMRADGSQRQQLTRNTSHEFLPAWSPDGQWIAYASDATGNYEIWVMRADGTAARQLTQYEGLDTRPAWSPDGQWIAFTSHRAGVLAVWVMRADGSQAQPLVEAPEGVCDPCWRVA